MTIDESIVVKYLQKNSPLFANQKNFEERTGQIEMLKAIVAAFNDKSFAFIEAGTGIGKSLAYLLPAIYNAAKKEQRSVISTHTITLQEQLLAKDIPLIFQALGLNLEAALVKGMGNYLCLRKMHDLLDHASLHNGEEQYELLAIKQWEQTTNDGSISDLEKTPKKLSWDKLNCESDACSFNKCPHYSNCYFFKARKKCKDAKILVVNHHLLLADLQKQEEDADQIGILPEYENLIIDEAHTLEEIATQSLASYTSFLAILRKLTELMAENSSLGKLQLLHKTLLEHESTVEKGLLDQITLDLFTEKNNAQNALIEAFASLGEFLNKQPIESDNPESKLTITPLMRSSEPFIESKKLFDLLIGQLNKFTLSLNLVIGRCSDIKDSKLNKKLQNLVIDLKAIASFFEKASLTIDDFFNGTLTKNKIYVLEWNRFKSTSAIRLLIIQLNISEYLSEHLFAPRDSAVLCSATLTYNKDFSFIQNQLGFCSEELLGRKQITKLIESPFDYQSQALLAIPSDIPDPRSPDYFSASFQYALKAAEASKGGAFILFTSYKMLEQCYQKISAELLQLGLLPLKQGDENRNTLLKTFKENSNAVLFGTDTFWEGIDVPGFNLRLVILTKLPFPVPSEPIFQAKCNQIEERGDNPFMEYAIPKAIVKFKQGFGRLIRTKTDYGCILCLDSRLINKAYGKLFIKSLPVCRMVTGHLNSITSELKNFYSSRGVGA